MNAKPLRHVDLYSTRRATGSALSRAPGSRCRGGGLSSADDPAAARCTTRSSSAPHADSRTPTWPRCASTSAAPARAAASFDAGEGEQDDVNAAIEWMKWKHPGKKLFVGGFSFGSWVASRVACERADVHAMFLIGTPVNKYDFSYLQHCEKPMLFIHGTQDEHGDVAQAREGRPAHPQRRERDRHRRGPFLHQAARSGGRDDSRLGRGAD